MFIQQWKTVTWGWLGKNQCLLESISRSVVSRSNDVWQVRQVRGEVMNKVRCNMMQCWYNEKHRLSRRVAQPACMAEFIATDVEWQIKSYTTRVLIHFAKSHSGFLYMWPSAVIKNKLYSCRCNKRTQKRTFRLWLFLSCFFFLFF